MNLSQAAPLETNDLLGDALVLENLRWLRQHHNFKNVEGASDPIRGLKFGFIAGRVRAVSEQVWSTDKVRELFGSRAQRNGPPKYRWAHILILAAALNVSVLDLLLPHRDHPERELLEAFAGDVFDIAPVVLSADNRGRLGVQRRFGVLLDEAIEYHPRCMAATRRFHETVDAARDNADLWELYLGVSKMEHDTVATAVEKSGRSSATLSALAEVTPEFDFLTYSDSEGRATILGSRTVMTEELALKILDEFGVLPSRRDS